MGSQAAWKDSANPEEQVSARNLTPRPVGAVSLDPLIAVLSRAAERSAPTKPPDAQLEAQG